MKARKKRLRSIHPGEILHQDFLLALNIGMNRLAMDLHVPVTRIAEIVHGRRAITTDTALRLSRYFNTSAHFWLNLQKDYELEVAEDAVQALIDQQIRPLAELGPAR
ncbi:MAG: HigA family addiction module antitoxin [Candidatus Binataceae bacterium]